MRWDITAGKGERGKRSVMQCANAAAQCTNKQNITKQRSNTRWRSRRRRMLTAPQHDGTRRPCQPTQWSANLLFAKVCLMREHHGRENGEYVKGKSAFIVVGGGGWWCYWSLMLCVFLSAGIGVNLLRANIYGERVHEWPSVVGFLFKDKSKNNLSARFRPF